MSFMLDPVPRGAWRVVGLSVVVRFAPLRRG
jgi:hypothetical protein